MIRSHQSANLVTGRLQVADSALGSIVSQLTKAISLATGANNGTRSANDVQADGAGDSRDSRRNSDVGEHELPGPIHFCRHANRFGAVQYLEHRPTRQQRATPATVICNLSQLAEWSADPVERAWEPDIPGARLERRVCGAEQSR